RNAVAMISWAQSLYSAGELAGVLASTSVCFDLSVYELFVPLASGGGIILARNALHLIEHPNREQVTLINTVPSAMTALVRAEAVPASVRVVNLAGEPLKDSLVQAIYALGTVEKVYDLYGPSEDTTYSTWLLMEANVNKEPSVGRPIANTQAHVLDQQMQPVPIGIVGELYLGGDGVATGYLHRPELTAERFIADLFGGNGRLYKTGDLVRYRPNGELDFLGRMDHQVKIRGYRIELGEIEARLNQHNAIDNSVVVALPDVNGTLQVVAYIVPTPGQTLPAEEVRQHLRQTLPEYMVPALFVFLDKLPLTPNGKINRRALPAPDQAQAQTETVYEPPVSETERCLARIWQTLLSVDQVGLNDHFFHLGGHSLLATQLISAIRSDLNVELSLLTIFDMPTLSALAAHVSDKLIDNVADDELAAMLQDLEALSEEEIEMLLAQE
ncbi:MAG: non-ribosomal peptide synthetase, partial [Anaerolineales bacterium]|nr:non-ribosomal peptide synthetase [Anaerolineales bacterium]